jgi:hypothetical protein
MSVPSAKRSDMVWLGGAVRPDLGFDSRTSYAEDRPIVLLGGCTLAVAASDQSGALLLSRNYFGFRA